VSSYAVVTGIVPLSFRLSVAEQRNYFTTTTLYAKLKKKLSEFERAFFILKNFPWNIWKRYWQI